MAARVVDASALAAVLFGEPRASQVMEGLEGGERLFAPTLLRYEIGSVCLRKIARYPEARDELASALRLFDRLPIQEIEVPISEVLPLAERSRLSVYDAAYLWLAKRLGCRLLTLDRKLLRAAERSG